MSHTSRALGYAVTAALALVIVAIVGGLLFLWRAGKAKGPAKTRLQRDLIADLRAAELELEAIEDPRLAVLACYERMQRTLERGGLPGSPADTPAEIVARVRQAGAVHGSSPERLAALFEHAKFSPHAVTEDMRREALGAVTDIREQLEAEPDRVPSPRRSRREVPGRLDLDPRRHRRHAAARADRLAQPGGAARGGQPAVRHRPRRPHQHRHAASGARGRRRSTTRSARRGSRRPGPEDLERMERLLAFARPGRVDRDTRVAVLLRAAVARRLRDHHTIDIGRQPLAARRILGDELYELAREPDDLDEPDPLGGLTASELLVLTHRIEEI